MATALKKQGKPRGKRSLPKSKKDYIQTVKNDLPPGYAYRITDACFGEFLVLKTANAWWQDSTKVSKLIDAYKFECTDNEARFYAGISTRQLEYFNEVHPEFCGIKAICKEEMGLMARRNFYERVKKGDVVTVDKYLGKKHKKEFLGAPEEVPRLHNYNNSIVFVDFSEEAAPEQLPPIDGNADVKTLDHAENQ